jgi:hypothetical protein
LSKNFCARICEPFAEEEVIRSSKFLFGRVL